MKSEVYDLAPFQSICLTLPSECLVLRVDNNLTSYAEVVDGECSGGSDQVGRLAELHCEGSYELGEIASAA